MTPGFTELASVDGTVTPTAAAMVPMKDDGLYRGDGAFEVIRLYDGKPFALVDHLDRLGRSAAAIELEFDRPALEAEIAALLAEASVPVVLHEAASGPIGNLPIPGRGRIVVVVGPEGGISDAELASFAAVGAEPVRLGSSVLRTSTAGVAAVAALLARTRRWG